MCACHVLVQPRQVTGQWYVTVRESNALHTGSTAIYRDMSSPVRTAAALLLLSMPPLAFCVDAKELGRGLRFCRVGELAEGLEAPAQLTGRQQRPCGAGQELVGLAASLARGLAALWPLHSGPLRPTFYYRS